MKQTPKTVANCLRFQLSLLRLAMVPNGSPKADRATGAAEELARLAENLPAVNPRRARVAE